MSDKQKQTPQQGQEQAAPLKREYTPPTIHAVDIRKDRNGIDYAVTLGTAQPDKRGYGDVMIMRSNTVSGFHNIMTDQKLKEFRSKTQQERFEYRNSQRTRSD